MIIKTFYDKSNKDKQPNKTFILIHLINNRQLYCDTNSHKSFKTQ